MTCLYVFTFLLSAPYVSVYPSVRTLTAAFLDRFSQKNGTLNFIFTAFEVTIL